MQSDPKAPLPALRATFPRDEGMCVIIHQNCSLFVGEGAQWAGEGSAWSERSPFWPLRPTASLLHPHRKALAVPAEEHNVIALLPHGVTGPAFGRRPLRAVFIAFHLPGALGGIALVDVVGDACFLEDLFDLAALSCIERGIGQQGFNLRTGECVFLRRRQAGWPVRPRSVSVVASSWCAPVREICACCCVWNYLQL